jgi:hypothetical protein
MTSTMTLLGSAWRRISNWIDLERQWISERSGVEVDEGTVSIVVDVPFAAGTKTRWLVASVFARVGTRAPYTMSIPTARAIRFAMSLEAVEVSGLSGNSRS